jgi:hypothetical protein
MIPFRTLAGDRRRAVAPPHADEICLACVVLPGDRNALLAALAGLRPVLGTPDAATDAVRIEVDPAVLRVVGVLATVAVHLAVADIRVEAVDPAALVVPAGQARAAHRVVADLAAAADLVRTRPASRGRRPSRRRPA